MKVCLPTPRSWPAILRLTTDLVIYSRSTSAFLCVNAAMTMETFKLICVGAKIMVERKPGIIDWFENLVYTGLLCVAATFLLLEVLGLTLS